MASSGAYINLYRKYRPQTFADIVGQPHVVEILRSSVKHNAVSHAYIFVGPRGTGKTSTARILAKAVNCLNPQLSGDPCNICDNCKAIREGIFVDLFEIDAASHRGIDNIRELQEKINFPPVQGRKKIYIIDEVHMLTREAFNALLKTLEEPPEHVIFILATTEPHKVPDTIMSRCERLDFHLADSDTLLGFLESIATQEGLKITPKAAKLLVEHARGSFRDLLSLLDSVVTAYKGQKITEAKVRKILRLPSIEQMKQVLVAVGQLDYAGVVKALEQIQSNGTDMGVFLNEFTKFVREQMLKSLQSGSRLWNVGVKLLASLFKAYDSIRLVFEPRMLIETQLWEFMDWGSSKPDLVEEFVKTLLGLKALGRVKKAVEAPKESAESVADRQESRVKEEPALGKRQRVKTLTEEHVQNKWQEFLRIFKEKNHNNIVYPVLLRAEVHRVDSTQSTPLLLLRVPDYPIYRQKLSKADTSRQINTAFSEVLDTQVTVEFVFDKGLNRVKKGVADTRSPKQEERAAAKEPAGSTPSESKPPKGLDDDILDILGDDIVEDAE